MMYKHQLRKSFVVLQSLIILVVLTFFGAKPAWSVPGKISYQGVLKNSDGTLVTAKVTMDLRIYNAEFDGQILWSETQSVEVFDGIYHVQLGSVKPLDYRYLYDDNLWLDVVVDGAALTPRIQFTSSAFCFRAQIAEDVLNQDITPRSISIQGIGQVIDSSGQWVGSPAGLQGPEGPQGPPGPQGTKGDKGDPGNLALAGQSCPSGTIFTGFDAQGNMICSNDFSQIFGIMGAGYSSYIPVILDNTALLEIEGLPLSNDVVVISGAGYDIERVPGFFPTGVPHETPGLAQEHDFIFETSGTDADAVKTYFDLYLGDPINTSIKSFSLIVKDAAKVEAFRINFFEFAPASYVPAADSRTRFTLKHRLPPNNLLGIQQGGSDPFLPDGSYNPATDTRVEIDGIVPTPGGSFYPEVIDDTVNRTLTLSYDIYEGKGILDWVESTIQGIQNLRSLSVIQESGGVETSRRNYMEVFPIKYEIYDGFGMFSKIKARVVLSYSWAEDA